MHSTCTAMTRTENFGGVSSSVPDFKCKGRLHTDLEGNVLRQLNGHNCPSGAENIGAKRVITALKRRAIITMEPPAVLRANTLQNVPTPILAKVPNKQAIKQVN